MRIFISRRVIFHVAMFIGRPEAFQEHLILRPELLLERRDEPLLGGECREVLRPEVHRIAAGMLRAYPVGPIGAGRDRHARDGQRQPRHGREDPEAMWAHAHLAGQDRHR